MIHLRAGEAGEVKWITLGREHRADAERLRQVSHLKPEDAGNVIERVVARQLIRTERESGHDENPSSRLGARRFCLGPVAPDGQPAMVKVMCG